ncbi:MAG: CinA family nicotinamide mononucleotide deamidase-related protein [Oceanospirillaceae bacterium]|nr:CinA family nicotinamide mononucleotide deamidase-related protein [Oceanospirillaceae bacterium]
MKLEMICTGEEVLAGQIVDTNAAWLGNQLMDAGFEMQRRTTVGDRLTDLVEVFTERSQQADIILVNGGLGPTADDLSAQAMAAAMDVELVENALWLTTLESWFGERNIKLTQSNLKQTRLPAGAVMVDNPVGTACGFRVKYNRAWLFFTPGVPHEFKQMVSEQFIPFVRSQVKTQQAVKVTKLLTIGIGESDMAERLEHCDWPSGLTLGYRSYTPYLELKLIARDVDAQQCNVAIAQAKALLGDGFVAQDKNTLAAEVHRLLVNGSASLAVAESLTGGEICSQLVAFAGSSNYLKQGVVSYCNEAKISLLKVSSETIKADSEVSLACVAQMAIGATRCNELIQETDYAIATSGVAGPSGGSDTIPVGSVMIAVKANQRVYAQHIALSSRRSRSYIRELTVAVAFDMLRRAILGLHPIADYGYIKRVDTAVYALADFT